MEKVPAIELRHITKRFGSVLANDDVSLTLWEGEILAVLGENGSGKTTLMNMIAGIYYPDAGEILVHGKEVSIKEPKDAFAQGIGMIHQHFKLVDVLTAAENIILGLPGSAFLNRKKVREKVLEISEKYGFSLDPDQKIYEMSVSQKQTVEIVKVLYRGADILILDEPTAVLTPQETERLFAVLQNMKKDGKAVVIITHKLQEVMAVSDRVAVLRKGRYIGSVATRDTSPQELTNMMVGHAVALNIARPQPHDVAPRLQVEHLTVLDEEGVRRLDDVTFTAMGGEILGIAGVSGSGQRELLEAIAGLQRAEAGGKVLYHDPAGKTEDLQGLDPRSIRNLGVHMSFVPEDRLGMGLVGEMGIVSNMMLRTYGLGRSIFTDQKTPRATAQQVIRELEVSTPGLQSPVRSLSGGNVQKVLVGREIAAGPTVLLTAYAVRGLDIHTSYTIYDLLNRQKEQGVAVVYVGEDLDVLLELCDRIMVLCGGKVTGILDGRTATREQVGLLMTHGKEDTHEA